MLCGQAAGLLWLWQASGLRLYNKKGRSYTGRNPCVPAVQREEIAVKRVVFDRFGPPAEVLRLEDDVPAPQPKFGEVLVRMLASPVNPSDLMYIAGKYGLKPTLPATPGFEGVGVVEATGGGLLGWFRKGKRVAVIGDRNGTWAEYTVTKARQVVPVPDDLSDELAATFFVNPATALAMTQDVLKVTRGAWLLQSAAGGELGKMVIRLGYKFAFRTINVVRRREQVEELKKLGADHVIVESDGPIPEQVRKLVPDGVRYAIDPVGGETGSQIIASLAALAAAACSTARSPTNRYRSTRGISSGTTCTWKASGSANGRRSSVSSRCCDSSAACDR